MRRSAAPLNAKLTTVAIPFLSDSAPVAADAKSNTSQSNNFAEQQVTPESYRLLRQKTQEALYREFPEARGHIEIYDQTANPETEFTRVSHSLALESPADRIDFEKQFKDDIAENGLKGHAFFFTDHTGRRYGVALGWPPRKGSDNIGIQKASIHETNHCLDHVLNAVGVNYSQERLGVEGLAEATAIKVISENGVGRQWGAQFTASYAQRGESDGFDSEFGAGHYDIYGATPYLLSKATYNEQNTHYDGSIKGWRAAFSEINGIRDKDFSRGQQRSFELMQVAITDIYATNHFEKNEASHQDWLKKISGLPEYQNLIAGDNTLNNNAAFHYVDPSITTEAYKASVTLLWKLHRDDPTDERVAHLLKVYRSANNVMLDKPLAKIEGGLVKDGVIKQDMIDAADNAVVAERVALFASLKNDKAPSASTTQTQQTSTTAKPKSPAAHLSGP